MSGGRSLAVILGVCLFAGSARAQFNECVSPSDVPEAVFFTILDEASFDFGDVSDSVCNKIVNKGVATCKSQVKAAAKCYNRALEANFEIAAKQCKQLETSEERAACKDGFKSDKEGGKAEVEADKDDGLAECEGKFEGALATNCAGLMKM